jgi:hypothetical protein
MRISLSEEAADELLSDAIARGRTRSVTLLLNALANPKTPRCTEALAQARTAGYDQVVKIVEDARYRWQSPETSSLKSA